MNNRFNIKSFTYEIKCENDTIDSKLEFEFKDNTMLLFLTANVDKPKFVELNWSFDSDDLYVLGDTWERSYGDLEFLPISQNDRFMPWYFVATDKKSSFCFGVKTQPNSFVNFKYNEDGIFAKVDCRNGGNGVKLNGRKILLCTFIFENYELPPFESLKDFCKKMCDAPILPAEKIYGGNNWYYAYGESSYAEIVSDTKLQMELSKGIDNKPFMVVDDCWEMNSLKGPYEPNEKFKDMKKLCEEMNALGARAGIWIRFLDNASTDVTSDMRILRNGKREYLDPTNKQVQQFIINDIERIKGWGYELIKHDFSTKDLFGEYGKDASTISPYENWHFEDETKTNAEIVLDFYRLIKDNCGDLLLIGCNTISHLCAGLVHINRTGDDTSGKEWDRTKKMGINTLAFRLAQNNAFYMVDADCVGILNDNISWDKNKQWLDVLSKSDTALFTSCATLTDEQKADIRNAYLEIQKDHTIKPVDIYENLTPSEWEIDREKVIYNW